MLEAQGTVKIGSRIPLSEGHRGSLYYRITSTWEEGRVQCLFEHYPILDGEIVKLIASIYHSGHRHLTPGVRISNTLPNAFLSHSRLCH